MVQLLENESGRSAFILGRFHTKYLVISQIKINVLQLEFRRNIINKLFVTIIKNEVRANNG